MFTKPMPKKGGSDSAVYRDHFVVPERAIDANGHVNNVAYVQWMQDIAVRHFEAFGGVEATHAVNGIWVVRTHQVEYLRPAFLGERIEARTWIVDFRRVRSLRRYEFARMSDGVLLARGETEWVFVDAETGRPASIPDDIKRLFRVIPSVS